MPDRLIDKTLTRIDKLLSFGENWNSYQISAPNPRAVNYAKDWILGFYELIAAFDITWINPAVAIGDNGEVSLEWWHDDKKLTIYISDETIDYIQVWGTTSDAKITDGIIKSFSDALSIFIWLIESNEEVV